MTSENISPYLLVLYSYNVLKLAKEQLMGPQAVASPLTLLQDPKN